MSLEFRGKHIEVLEDNTNEIDVEGARYSGKTWLICAKIILSCLAHPGIEWLACRYSDKDTQNKIRPEFVRIALLYGVQLTWNADENCYLFPVLDGKVSKVYCYGLKAPSLALALSKVRGLGVACIWNDQTEELPQALAEELRFGTRQPGYPHQLIFSPNPPDENHYLADQFPDEGPLPAHRKYYRFSLYENRHNLAPGKIEEIEELYPVTHAKYRSLVLGMRGPNVTGDPVYGQGASWDGVFAREDHVKPVAYNPGSRLLEAIQVGQHHPVWTIGQRTPYGLSMLGGIIGKRMFLDDFLPWVDFYREEWFEGAKRRGMTRVCTDPPPSDEAASMRYTHISVLRENGMAATYRQSGTAPDVRESVIQNVAGMMKRKGAFAVNADPTRWLMVSHTTVKQSPYFIHGLEGSYVWSEKDKSVSNKQTRHPKPDEFVDGWQRCLENTVLNFCAGQIEIPAPVPMKPHRRISAYG